MPVPDLTDVDLRILRTVDLPEVGAAVDDMLRHPERLTATWWSDTTEGVSCPGPAQP